MQAASAVEQLQTDTELGEVKEVMEQLKASSELAFN